jgi:hypothetical protein
MVHLSAMSQLFSYAEQEQQQQATLDCVSILSSREQSRFQSQTANAAFPTPFLIASGAVVLDCFGTVQGRENALCTYAVRISALIKHLHQSKSSKNGEVSLLHQEALTSSNIACTNNL